MAAAPLPTPQGAAPTQPPSPAPAGNTPQGGPAIVQLVAIVTRASDQIAQAFPPASPETQEIQNQLNLIQQKMTQTVSPQQPAAPPV